MKMKVILGALAASLLLAGPATSQAPVTAPVVPQASSGCAELFSLKDYRHDASRTYKRKSVSSDARAHLAKLGRCQHTAWARRWVRRLHHRFKRERTVRAQILSVTPYSCSFGRSAIPCYIVQCESHGDWGAANPSGAIGFYQFLGKRIVWPVRTDADKAAHHRLAAALWDGGRGAHHWSQCL